MRLCWLFRAGGGSLGELPPPATGLPALFRAEGGEAGENTFAGGIGLRAGVSGYPSVTENAVSLRGSVGLYYHFAETFQQRFEGALDFAPSSAEFDANSYLLLRLTWVRYLGEAGLFYWTVGGGGIYESRYGEQDVFGSLHAGAGYWLDLGQKGIDTRLDVQLPVGPELNSLLVVAFTVGYDF